MGLIGRLREAIGGAIGWTGARIAGMDPREDKYYDVISGSSRWGWNTQAGITVGPDTALRFATVYACIRIISSCLAMLPVKLYRRTGVDGREEARNHPLYSLLHRRPNSYQTPYEFKEEVIGHLAARGNAYVEKILDRRGIVAELWPIHPDMLSVDWYDRKSGRRRVYDVSSAYDGRPRLLYDDQIWHPHLRSLDGGLTGGSPIGIGSEGMGIAMAAQVFAGNFFGNGARPGGILSSDQTIRADKRKELSDHWNEVHGGAFNSSKLAVLGSGMKYQSITLNPKDALLLEVLDISVKDAARIWGIPLHLLQEHEKSTSWGSGIEHLGIGLVTYTLAPYVALLEQGISSSLIVDHNRYFAEFNVDALLRGDLRSRYEAYAIGVNANTPFLRRDEIRKKENLPPAADSEFPTPANNVGGAPIGQTVEAMADAMYRVALAKLGGNGQSGRVEASEQ